MSHSFTFPDQLPVARYLLLGEKRTREIGRSSPICEPKFAKLWMMYRLRLSMRHRKNVEAHLHVCEYLLPDVDDAAEGDLAVYSLLRDSFLSSTWVQGKKKGHSKHLCVVFHLSEIQPGKRVFRE